MEDSMGKKLYWSVCDLHSNELGLRHLFQKVDGPKTGNNSFKGHIGKSLGSIENLQWNESFVPIKEGPEPINMPEHILKDLSTDQKYMYLVWKSIFSGTIEPKVKNMKPGLISHSRWLTLACRLGTAYMKHHGYCEQDSKN